METQKTRRTRNQERVRSGKSALRPGRISILMLCKQVIKKSNRCGSSAKSVLVFKMNTRCRDINLISFGNISECPASQSRWRTFFNFIASRPRLYHEYNVFASIK